MQGNTSGLISYYDFEDGPGSTTITDSTGSGVDGTLNNMDANTDWELGPDVFDELTLTNDFNGTSDASGIYPVGDTTVVWTVTDALGNSNTCNQIITVTGDASCGITYTFDDGVWLPNDPNGVAIALDSIIVSSGDATLNTDLTVDSVTVNPGAGLTVELGTTITTNTLTLESSSTSYSSLILDGTVVGTMTYERHVNINGSGTTGSNDLISAPLTGQAFNDLAAANPNILNNGSLYLFGPFEKTTGQYVNWSGTETATLNAGVGYRTGTTDNGIVTFTGTAENGTVINDIENSGPIRQEWNLVGNPYPSYLNVQDFLNHDVGGVTNIQLFDASTAAIYGYDGSAQNGWTIYNLANTTASTLIAPGQGFFVSADDTNTGLYNLEFTPAMRSTGTSDDFIQGRNAELVYLKLNLSAGSETSRTEFYFNDNASQGLDVGYDAEAFDDMSLYSHLIQDNEGKAIALQTLNPSDLSEVSIPLGVNANQGEQITFSISDSTLPQSVNVYLDDVVANTSTLLTTGDYVVTPTTNLSGTGRFFLRTSEDALSTIENSLETLNIFALNTSKEIVVSGLLKEQTNLILYDIQGRQVFVSELDTTSLDNRIDVSSLSGGVYIVSVDSNSQKKTQKIVLK
ncbi:MAG: T9SS type A sorting domain-containing protein [Algicola sp.]|nr:T9SS type A sorting domain-containing protein [Algicola sp.]